MEIIHGDLIIAAQMGQFDVIAHGCNCFCLQGGGIAGQMSQTFHTNDPRYYKLEKETRCADIQKLGRIESHDHPVVDYSKEVTVINCYTQYMPGPNLDYEALTLCMRKINNKFRGKHIGLPLIGCGIAGGNWSIVKNIIEKELIDCKVTVVEYNKF